MLVLTRRTNQAIELRLETGETVRISVERLTRSRVALGIEAPPNVHVVRGELGTTEVQADTRHAS